MPGFGPSACIEDMEKANVKFIQDGDASLLVWVPPSDAVKAGAAPSCFVIPLLARRGGLLVMVPERFHVCTG